MRKAYDRILNDYVDAEYASINTNFELYRYQCPNCWEEVYLCAANSFNQATHFRHRDGNNNIECENYLGNRNNIIRDSLIYSNIIDRVGFYFLNSTKMFNIGIKFTANEISDYKEDGLRFEVMGSETNSPFISVPIDRSRFYPDIFELIPITKFSWTYHVCSLTSSKEYKYELFKKNNRGSLYPSFFKIQSNSVDNDFMAKFIQSDTLYTNIPYFVVFSHPYETLSSHIDVNVKEIIEFNTMGQDFRGLILTFTRKTPDIDQKLRLWELKLEVNEELTVLWPPTRLHNELITIGTDYAYVFSTFSLHAHANINLDPEDIKYLGNGISKILVNKRVNIYMKNIETIIEKDIKIHNEFDDIVISHIKTDKYLVLDNSTYLFNSVGITQLKKGMSIFLTPGSEVRNYHSGYLNRVVSVKSRYLNLSDKKLLQDILKHYKREEIFKWKDFKSIKLSDEASAYIEQCAKGGFINSAAKLFIKAIW